jgi:predicted metal-dependent hydrolase
MSKIKIDKIIRSKRKTIALVVTQEATLVVRAPFTTSLTYIENLVRKKRTWIQEKQARFQRNQSKVLPKEFVNGEGFWYLGKEYKLEIVQHQDKPVVLEEHLKIAQERLPHAREYLIAWYKEQALQKITKRVEWYAKQTGLEYKSVKITNAQKRYGSCGAKGTLNFSWRLIMAPLRVLDYVVVHELAHLDEKNHSRKFWNKVKLMLPDYRERQEWLKENGSLLQI